MNVPIAYWPGEKNSKLESWKSSGTIRWSIGEWIGYSHQRLTSLLEVVSHMEVLFLLLHDSIHGWGSLSVYIHGWESLYHYVHGWGIVLEYRWMRGSFQSIYMDEEAFISTYTWMRGELLIIHLLTTTTTIKHTTDQWHTLSKYNKDTMMSIKQTRIENKDVRTPAWAPSEKDLLTQVNNKQTRTQWCPIKQEQCMLYSNTPNIYKQKKSG